MKNEISRSVRMRLAAGVCAVLITTGGTVGIIASHSVKGEASEAKEQADTAASGTAAAEKSDTKAVSAGGTVTASQLDSGLGIKDTSARLTVEEVLAESGETVEEGARLYKITEDSLAKAEKTLLSEKRSAENALLEKKSNYCIDQNKAKALYESELMLGDTAEYDYNSSLSSLDEALQNAYDAYSGALTTIAGNPSEISSKKQELEALQTEIEELQEKRDKLSEELEKQKKAYEQASESCGSARTAYNTSVGVLNCLEEALGMELTEGSQQDKKDTKTDAKEDGKKDTKSDADNGTDGKKSDSTPKDMPADFDPSSSEMPSDMSGDFDPGDMEGFAPKDKDTSALSALSEKKTLTRDEAGASSGTETSEDAAGDTENEEKPSDEEGAQEQSPEDAQPAQPEPPEETAPETPSGKPDTLPSDKETPDKDEEKDKEKVKTYTEEEMLAYAEKYAAQYAEGKVTEALTALYDTAKADTEQKKKALEKSEAALKEAEESYDSASESSAAAEKETEEAQNSEKELTKEISNLENDLSKAKKNLTKLRKEYNSLSSSYDTDKLKLQNTLDSNNASCENAEYNYKITCATLDSELAEAQEAYDTADENLRIFGECLAEGYICADRAGIVYDLNWQQGRSADITSAYIYYVDESSFETVVELDQNNVTKIGIGDSVLIYSSETGIADGRVTAISEGTAKSLADVRFNVTVEADEGSGLYVGQSVNVYFNSSDMDTGSFSDFKGSQDSGDKKSSGGFPGFGGGMPEGFDPSSMPGFGRGKDD